MLLDSTIFIYPIYLTSLIIYHISLKNLALDEIYQQNLKKSQKLVILEKSSYDNILKKIKTIWEDYQINKYNMLFEGLLNKYDSCKIGNIKVSEIQLTSFDISAYLD